MRRSKEHLDWISYATQITIGNCDRRPLDKGREIWKGFLGTRKKTKTGKTLYVWMLTSQNATKFLSDVYPYLQIKREQAYLALELQTNIDEKGRNGLKLTEDILKYRKDLQIQIREYNARKYYGLTLEDKILQEKAAKLSVGGGCCNCGCGDWTTNNGDPLNLTLSRLRLMALRNNSTVEDQAKNIIATVMGYITQREPLEYDEIKIDIKRLKKEAPTESRYVPRKENK